jgi:hypothetical protein
MNGNRNQIFNDIIDAMEYHIDNNLSGGVISNDRMEEINMMLFNHLAKGSNNRDRQLVINRKVRGRRGESDKDFKLRLRVDVDESLRSRRPHVDRSRIAERESNDLREVFERYTMSVSEMDNKRDIVQLYVNTYMCIEDGFADMFEELFQDGKMSDPGYLDMIASGEVFYEYGGFRIFPMANESTWSLSYETTPLISTGIKNDFGWNN